MCGTKRPLPHPAQLAHRWRRRERLPHGRGRRTARDTRADVNGADYDGEAEDDAERPDENSTPAYPPAPEVHTTAQHATRANRSQPCPSARLSDGARTELPTAAGEVGVGSEASARTSGIRSPFRFRQCSALGTWRCTHKCQPAKSTVHAFASRELLGQHSAACNLKPGCPGMFRMNRLLVAS
jgi:hypothetical protein